MTFIMMFEINGNIYCIDYVLVDRVSSNDNNLWLKFPNLLLMFQTLCDVVLGV